MVLHLYRMDTVMLKAKLNPKNAVGKESIVALNTMPYNGKVKGIIKEKKFSAAVILPVN